MISLLLATFFSASFGLVVRYAQRRKLNLIAVGALNYTTATLFHLACCGLGGRFAPSSSTMLIGIMGGICYVTAYFIFFPFMRLRGVSIATAVIRLSVLIPILVSVLFWGEQPNASQSIGALLALVALPLLTLKPDAANSSFDRRAVYLLIALFFGNGLCSLAVRGFDQTGVQGQASMFLTFLFGTAMLVSSTVWWFHREGSSRRDILPGIALGLCNALGNLTLVAALSQLPSVLVFPIHSVLGLIYVALFARLAWQERIERLETAGMVVALAAMALINFGR